MSKGIPRKSVTWNVSSDEDSESSGSSGGSENSRSSQSSSSGYPPPYKGKKRSKLSRIASTTSRSSRKPFGGWLCPCCCGPKEAGYDEESPYIRKSMYNIQYTEDDIAGRMQQAVNELGHREVYDLDSEIVKWNKMLELEQKAFEESGTPKFKYKHFRKNRYLTVHNHPLYGTAYDNHRKLESRLEYFRFGANLDERFDLNQDFIRPSQRDIYDKTAYHDSCKWKSDSHTMFATLALICSASNFIRFPDACYANGGFTFLLTYCLMIAAVGQPLLYFEMVLGQFAFHGPTGFAELHPYAAGLPYAIAFVCVVFGTSKSVNLAYCMLYSLLSLIMSPGQCSSGWKTMGFSIPCFPYVDLERDETLLEHLWRSRFDNATYRTQNISFFSTELFFRETILDSDWVTKKHHAFIHWKLVIAFLMVFGVAYGSIHYKMSGKVIRRWMHYSLLLPVMVFILFLHQISMRGAIYETIAYFVSIDADHVSALSIWSEAFDMVLSTLGIGYGFHWSLSGRNPFNHRKLYGASWRICGYAVLFGMISSLVVFCEVGIVGQVVGTNVKHFHSVFVEELGVSFICYSGALLKFGGNSTIFLAFFFLIFVIYGMWTQIVVADIILRWIEQGHIFNGKVRLVVKNKLSAAILVIGLQLLIISPYLFDQGSAILASENIFGGSFAAYTVVLAELIVAVYMYGFARFLVDLEIMIKRPLPALFQIQIRYIVIPAIGLFTIPMLLNVYLLPSLYGDRNTIGWMFYVGLLINFAPVLIILSFGWFSFVRNWDKSKAETRVSPEPFISAHDNEDVERMRKWIDPRFVAKANAPSQQSHSRTLRSEIYHVVEHNMQYIYQAQLLVERQFQKLLRFKRIQARWLNLVILALAGRKIRSMRKLGQNLMLHHKLNNDRMDIHFLEKALEQIVNFTFLSAIRKIQRMPMGELLPYLADELIHSTTFHAEDFQLDSESSSSSEGSNKEDSDNGNDESLDADTYEEKEEKERKKYLEIHQKIVGKLEKSAEESRVLLTIRLKRGLGLPHLGEMNVLTFLRRERSRKGREISCWTMKDPPPIDHFVPISVSRNGVKECFTVFHAVVVQGNDHFVLKRLPVPRPTIIRVTKSFIFEQPGKDLVEKFANIVTKRMRRNLGEILVKRNLKDWSQRRFRRHMWKLAGRVDDDVYDFLDRILTCVIVIVDERDTLESKLKPRMYLKPRTRRRKPPPEKPRFRKTPKNEWEMITYSELANRHELEAKWVEDYLQEPSDIVFHRSDTSVIPVVEETSDLDVKSSSGLTSTISSTEDQEHQIIHPDHFYASEEEEPQEPEVAQVSSSSRSTRYVVEENLQHRDRKSLASRPTLIYENAEESDRELWLTPSTVKHLSGRRWKKQHDAAVANTDLRYTTLETMLHNVVDVQAEFRAVLPKSKSADVIREKERLDMRKAVSLQNLRYFMQSEVDFTVDIQEGKLVAVPKPDPVRQQEDKLGNMNPNFAFFGYGKTLVVSVRGVGKDNSSSSASTSSSRVPGSTRSAFF